MPQETAAVSILRRFGRSAVDHVARLALVLLVVEVVAGPFTPQRRFGWGSY